jgi:glycosyltransferase involved in cell wall biosynthesis
MATSVEIVIPVLNEERALPSCIETLIEFTSGLPQYDWKITVADNGSTDRTPEVIAELAEKYPTVGTVRLEERGRGRALKKAWLASDADVRCYMDVDLSTDIKAIPALVSAVASEGYDVAIGSRLSKGSEVVGRKLTREITSRGYNMLIKLMFWPPFRDAQCGFKAVSRKAAETLIPLIKDNAWFMDTEMLLLATAAGYRIRELPVRWVDDPDTRVKVVSTAWQDMKGLLRLRFRGRPRPNTADSPAGKAGSS